MDNQEETKSWVTSLLTGMGMPSNWAKVLAGAIIGALAAVMSMSNTSCTALGGTSVTLTSPTYGAITVTLPAKQVTAEQAKEAVAESTPESETANTVSQAK